MRKPSFQYKLSVHILKCQLVSTSLNVTVIKITNLANRVHYSQVSLGLPTKKQYLLVNSLAKIPLIVRKTLVYKTGVAELWLW